MSSAESLLSLVGHGESPGRLDFMGGVADYSGSMVLEMPIRGKTRVEVSYLPQPLLYLESSGFDKFHFNFKLLSSLLLRYRQQQQQARGGGGEAGSEAEAAFLAAVRAHLEEEKVPSWCRYVIGCLVVFCVRKHWTPGAAAEAALPSSSPPPLGLRFFIKSEVNASMGVSSSAAIEIATIRAISALAQQTGAVPSSASAASSSAVLSFHPTEIAHIGQTAENRIVGAPCGLMDQLSVAYGRPLHLLPILCRPDILFPNIPLPDGVVVVGWPSGIKHSVGESPYALARAAAFMGKAMMERIVGVRVAFTAEFSPSTLLAPPSPLPLRHQASAPHAQQEEAAHASAPYVSRLSLLPISMLGADFLRQYAGVDDALSVIRPELRYPVRDAFSFPVQENFRCQLVASLLSSLATAPAAAAAAPAADASARSASAGSRESVLSQIGELLYQSHRGYSAMGLGCAETDAIISILQARRDSGVYGGRISGGGSGGTVIVLCESAAVEGVRAELRAFHSSQQLDLIMA